MELNQSCFHICQTFHEKTCLMVDRILFLLRNVKKRTLFLDMRLHVIMQNAFEVNTQQETLHEEDEMVVLSNKGTGDRPTFETVVHLHQIVRTVTPQLTLISTLVGSFISPIMFYLFTCNFFCLNITLSYLENPFTTTCLAIFSCRWFSLDLRVWLRSVN